MDTDGLDLASYTRQKDESARAFHAFEHYLKLPSWGRSLLQAYRAHQVTCMGKVYADSPKRLWISPLWQSWRFKHAWPERAARFDAEVSEQQRRDHLQAIREANQRHISLAVDVQRVAANKLKDFLATGALVPLSPLALARILEIASSVERKALGEPNEIIQQTETPSEAIPDLRGLSDDELNQLEQLLLKAKLASGLVSV